MSRDKVLHLFPLVAVLAMGWHAGQSAAAPVPQSVSVPVSFERNTGQVDKSVEYLVRGHGGALFLQGSQAIWAPGNGQGEVRLHMNLLGARADGALAGERPIPTRSHYLLGNKREDWRRDVPHYARLRLPAVYPGIDLIYHPAQDARLEYDFVLSPGADPASIRLGFEGMAGMRLNESGDLVLSLPGGEVVQRAPVAYQDGDHGRADVPVAFRLAADGSVGFQLAAYDTTIPLVIDPVLTFSTYLGDSRTVIQDVKVVADGSAYLYGHTSFSGLPTTPGALQTLPAGGYDAFIAKLAADASHYEFITYLGGSGDEANGGSIGPGIHVDTDGAMYVTGRTDSADFPLKKPLQANLVGQDDFYVAKLDPTGSRLIYSTYLGGPDWESPRGAEPSEAGPSIAVDRGGNAIILGYSNADGYPVVNAHQDHPAGGLDGVLTKLNKQGSSILFSTYLGGSGNDKPRSLKLDASGNIYVTGRADSADFPLVKPLQGQYGGRGDVFVSKFNSNGQLVFSTLWGGSNTEKGRAIDLDAQGNVYITGNTQSTDFPTVSALQGQLAAGGDMFLMRINSRLDKVAFSTYLGGADDDEGSALVLDAEGNVYIGGYSHSADFPTVNPIQAELNGTKDVVVLKINNRGSRILFSTYLGGTGAEEAIAMGLDTAGLLTVAGTTDSLDFPLLDPLQSDTGSVFISRIAP
jgi:hypothetical protein